LRVGLAHRLLDCMAPEQTGLAGATQRSDSDPYDKISPPTCISANRMPWDLLHLRGLYGPLIPGRPDCLPPRSDSLCCEESIIPGMSMSRMRMELGGLRSGAGVGADTRSATVGGYRRAVGDVGGAASSALIPRNLGPPTLLLALNPLENVVVANSAARKKAVHCILLVCEDFEYRI